MDIIQKLMPPKNDSDPMLEAACVLISDESGFIQFNQVKDSTHPATAARRTISLWGGAIEKGETPQQALLRELVEELPQIGEALHHFTDQKPFAVEELDGVQWDGKYRAHFFLCRLPDEVAEEMVWLSMHPDLLVTEGIMYLHLYPHIWRSMNDSTENFLASHDTLIRKAMPAENSVSSNELMRRVHKLSNKTSLNHFSL